VCLEKSAKERPVKILISDKTHEICARTLQGFRGLSVVEKPGLGPEELLAAVSDAAALIVRSATRVTREVITAAQALKVIGRAGAGVDNIDVPAASERGIVVMNTPGGNANAVAELTLGMMFALARSIPRADASMKAGRWEKKQLEGGELAGKTLGLVGVGKVGARVARKAACLDMKVLAADPLVPEAEIRALGAEPVSLERLLAESDFLSVHAPKNSETAGMLSRDAFARLKPGAFLINCARGGIVVESDLLEALEQGRLAGAAMDVYEQEPPQERALAEHPRVIATPHIGASTREAQIVVAEMIAGQVGRFLTTGEVLNAVNR
jgi:D-3-phosphoglycerate dehydrogenase